MNEKTWVEISEKNILHNIKSLRNLLDPNVKFMAILKSNAYGHGLGRMNKICVQSGLVDFFGVDSIDEALLLRKLGNKKPILVLGYVPFERIGECMENDISVAAYNFELLKYLNNVETEQCSVSTKKRLKIHIKVETGTSRQGIEGKELVDFIKHTRKNPHIMIEGIYTHFANIEDTADPSYAFLQLKKFNENLKKINFNHDTLKHCAASAAIINHKATHFDMVRAGISMYGYWPSQETKAVAHQNKVDLELKPALTWKTRIAQIKNIKANTPVSYGLTERVKRNSRIAILPIGYWDGYDRGLSSFGEVLISGRRAKVLGRVCMNMTIIDITDIAQANLFDEVVLLGRQKNDHITAEDVANKLGTINYEVITRVNPIIKRIIA